MLFSLLINELTKEINANGKHGVQMSPDIVQILILLFADDVALLSDSIIGLQTQLNILFDVSKRLDLIVNLEKSNVIVFRNGGYLAESEKWTYGNDNLSVVNMYKYLGIVITSRLSFQPTMEDLAERAMKGVACIIRLLWSMKEHSPAIFFKLFDSQIQPILTYGSEIWGLTANQSVIERVHLCAMKRFLCVSQKTPKHLVYGELGRYPLYVNTYAKCLKFWLHVTMMDNSRFPKKAYTMMLMLQQQNYTTWACKIRNILYMFGFGIVWEMQTVGNIKLFIAEFKQRLKDCYLQDWHSAIHSHSFYNVYSTYCQSITLCPYFQWINCMNIRKLFIRFRIGMLGLNNHFLQFRDQTIPNTGIMCPFCVNSPETELHFLFVCPMYADLRCQFIPCKYSRHPSLFKMSLLLSCTCKSVIVGLSHFISKAWKRRCDCM